MSDAPTVNELMAAAGHVSYEIGSVAECYAVLIRLADENDPNPLCSDPRFHTMLQNSVLEALLVHVRCLIEFLVGRPATNERKTKRSRSEKDIGPTWFAPDWETPGGPHVLDEWLGKIDAHVSHLSRKRAGVHGDEKPAEWTGRMVEALIPELQRFRSEATSQHLAFDTSVGRFVEIIDRLRVTD